MKKLILCVFALVCMSVHAAVEVEEASSSYTVTNTTNPSQTTHTKITFHSLNKPLTIEIINEARKYIDAFCRSGLSDAVLIDDRTVALLYRKEYQYSIHTAKEVVSKIAKEHGINLSISQKDV